jgi:hypothetical protein
MFRAALAAILLVMARGSFAAQPLPEEVNIRGFAKLDGKQLLLRVRLPLATVRDVQFPLHPDTDFIDIPAARSMARGLARYWIGDRFAVYRNGVLLAKPSVRNARFTGASAQAPEVADDAKLNRNQIWLETELAFALPEAGGTIEFQPRVADLGVRVKTELKYTGADGAAREFSFSGDPGRFPFEPSGAEAGAQFFRRGITSLGAASDYLLFLFCLALPLRRYRDITPAALAVVIGLSLTFTASWLSLAPDRLWFPPFVATLAGCAVLFTALANIAGKPSVRRRALLALAAGLVFGFRLGFELASKLQFGGGHSVIAAISFNAGVVTATLLLLALLVPVLAGLFHFARTKRVELIVVSALAADTAWQWVSERWLQLIRYPLGLPDFDTAFLAVALRWLAILTVAGGVGWFLNGWLAAREQRTGS